MLVAVPIPTCGWGWRGQEPDPGASDATGLLAEAGGVAEISAPGGEAREREPGRLGGLDLGLERRAGLRAERTFIKSRCSSASGRNRSN